MFGQSIGHSTYHFMHTYFCHASYLWTNTHRVHDSKRAAHYFRLAVDEGVQQHFQMIGISLIPATNAEREKYKALAPGEMIRVRATRVKNTRSVMGSNPMRSG